HGAVSQCAAGGRYVDTVSAWTPRSRTDGSVTYQTHRCLRWRLRAQRRARQRHHAQREKSLIDHGGRGLGCCVPVAAPAPRNAHALADVGAAPAALGGGFACRAPRCVGPTPIRFARHSALTRPTSSTAI